MLGEIKNTNGTFKKGQRDLLTKVIDGFNKGGALLYITHTKDVHQGDKVVNVGDCLVEEYYFKGKWLTPYRFITVRDALLKMEGVTNGKRND